MRFEDRVVLISGGASGIGAAAAERFVAEGAKVLVADINQDAGEQLCSRLGPSTRFVRADHTVSSDDVAAVAGAVSCWGGLDILFCNAGRGSFGTIECTSDSDLQADLDSHVLGPTRLVKAALPYLHTSAKADRGPSTVFTVSRASLKVRPNTATYAVAKHATLGLMRSLAVDLGPAGIRVNAVCPGMVDTALSRTMSAAYGGNADAMFGRFAAESPLGRTALDVANVVVFLASEEARGVHSQALVVDCGTHGI